MNNPTDQTPRETVAPTMNVGLTEIATLIVLFGSLLTSLFGQDWGISKNAVTLAPGVVKVAVFVLAAYRVIKHISINRANATVTAAAISAAANSALVVPPSSTPYGSVAPDLVDPAEIIANQALVPAKSARRAPVRR